MELSKLERELLVDYAREVSLHQTAARLHYSWSYLQRRRFELTHKLGCNSMQKALLRAINDGLLTEETTRDGG